MERNKAPNKYKWNFNHLYMSIKEWEKELNSLDNFTKKILALKNFLHKFKNFKTYHQLDEKMTQICMKLQQYLHLSDLDMTNKSYLKIKNLFMIKLTEINTQLAFIEPEIKVIGESQIKSFLQKDNYLKKFEYYYRHFFKNANYILDSKSESLISQMSRSRHSALELYNTLIYADKNDKFINFENKNQKLTLSLLTNIMENTHPTKDQDFRKEVSKKFHFHISDKKHSFAKIYESILITINENVKIRNFSNSLDASLLGDDVDRLLYENLVKYSRKYSNLVKKYELLKKNYFKLDKYFTTDSRLKLANIPKQTYRIKQAQILIKEALKPLGSEYQILLDKAWADHIIDYFQDTNKRDGAYSSGGGFVDPIILMNWDDSLRSVATLAHEIGHSVHSIVASKNQLYPLDQYPIILAEIASTLNEHLLFDYLFNQTNDKQIKIYLLQNRIDDLIGTFFRQVQFADFEKQCHELVEHNHSLNAENLDDLFSKISKNHGNDIFDKNLKQKHNFTWPRISHFFQAPFYVYKYATSIVASFELYNRIKKGDNISHWKFLKAGGYKEPLEILKDDLQIDFSEQNIYEPLINNLEMMIEKLIVLLK